MTMLRTFLIIPVFLLIVPGICLAKDPWPAIPPDELTLKDDPLQPGADAMILYHEFVRNDMTGTQFVHMRIKVFRESGRKWADVEIPYENIGHAPKPEARVTYPDGRVVYFDGPFYDKTVAKGRDFRYSAKTFTLPNVSPGVIIEYRYEVPVADTWHYRYVAGAALHIKKEIFRFVPSWGGGQVYWNAYGTPALQARPGSWLLEFPDVPPYPEEDSTPPEGEIKPHVDFYYWSHEVPKANYWNEIGKNLREFTEKFIGRSGQIRERAAALTLPQDPPETKLRKLYDYVQTLRNFSFERAKSDKELEKEKIKRRENAESVLKTGYGNSSELTDLFVGLAREAGLDADLVLVPSRDKTFFHQDFFDPYQMDDEIAVVSLANRDLYLDPGTADCPFGSLAWEHTAVQAMRIGKSATPFVQTPTPHADESMESRQAELGWRDGQLIGTVTMRETGHLAMSRRHWVRLHDETEFKKMIEDEVKGQLPAGSTVEVVAIRGQRESGQPLEFDCKVTVPNVGSETGTRLLVPLAIFQSQLLHPFRHEKRLYPVYYSYPTEERDVIHLALPAGYETESLPQEIRETSDFAIYNQRVRTQPDGILLERRLAFQGFYYPVQQYPVLKSFFDKVRHGDEENIVFHHATTAAK